MVNSEIRRQGLPSILIVEDDPDMLEFVRLMLEQANCGVQVANSGEEALDTLRRATRAART